MYYLGKQGINDQQWRFDVDYYFNVNVKSLILDNEIGHLIWSHHKTLNEDHRILIVLNVASLRITNKLVMYITAHIKLSLADAMSILSRVMSNTGRSHWDDMKWVFKLSLDAVWLGLISTRTQIQNQISRFG